MRIAFRADASLAIGTGHVMRCLTLADALAQRGAHCVFLCRDFPGHLFDLIRERGHALIALSPPPGGAPADPDGPPHAAWLGLGWEEDAAETADASRDLGLDWLVADHYGLDLRWERALRVAASRLAVIDDLADRDHDCDLLLDQNLSDGMADRYASRVPSSCRLLVGPRYALLRPQFAARRAESLARRRSPVRERLLVFMSGSDPSCETAKVIEGAAAAKRRWRHVDAVVGGGYPARGALERLLRPLPSAALHVQTPAMADLMAAADLAVTGGGSATWEKCALGLPSLVTVMAENQRPGARLLQEMKAQVTLGDCSSLTPGDYARALDAVTPAALAAMTEHAAALCDGTGTALVADALGAPA